MFLGLSRTCTHIVGCQPSHALLLKQPLHPSDRVLHKLATHRDLGIVRPEHVPIPGVKRESRQHAALPQHTIVQHCLVPQRIQPGDLEERLRDPGMAGGMVERVPQRGRPLGRVEGFELAGSQALEHGIGAGRGAGLVEVGQASRHVGVREHGRHAQELAGDRGVELPVASKQRQDGAEVAARRGPAYDEAGGWGRLDG